MKKEVYTSEVEPRDEKEKLVSMLEEYEVVYLTEDLDESSYARRVALQSKLSEEIILSGNLDIAREIVTYFRQTKSSLESKQGKLPHIHEAIQSSLEIQSLAQEISSSFSNNSIATLQFGSATWGAFYSTHRDSDVDLEIVVDTFDESIANNELFDDNRTEILEALRISEEHDLDMLLYKAIHQDREIMLHFIPRSSFERFMKIQLVSTTVQRMGFRELRNYFNGVTDYSDRCSFTDDRRSWIASHNELDNGWHIVEKPVFQIEDDTLFNGIWTEWHLTPPVVLDGDVEWSLSLRSGLYEEFIERMIHERKNNPNNSKYSNILERKFRMPEWLIEKMDQNAEEIVQKKVNY